MRIASSIGMMVFGSAILTANIGMCREKITEIAPASSPVQEVPSIQPNIEVQPMSVADASPLQEIERIAAIKYADILQLDFCREIPPELLRNILIAAYKANISPSALMDIFKVGKSYGINAIVLGNITDMALSTGIAPSDIISVLTISYSNCITVEVIEEIFAASKKYGIAPISICDAYLLFPASKASISDISKVLSVGYASGLDEAPLMTILKMAKSDNISPMEILNILCATKALAMEMQAQQDIKPILSTAVVSGLPIEMIAEILVAMRIKEISSSNAMVQLAKEVNAKISDIAALVIIEQNKGSKWDVVGPAMFSTLWDIKRRGLAAEKDGDKEESERLWQTYWDIFVQSRK